VWHEEDRETEMWLAKEKFPQFDKITFMDITKCKKFGIIGGVVNGEVVISLFTFDTQMNQIGVTTIPCQQEYAQTGITGLRVSSQHDGLLFATTRTSLSIVQIDLQNLPNINMGVVKQIELGCDMGKFVDICTVGNKVYLAGDNQDNGFVSLEFSKDI
jgi:hypothetical protein